MAAPDSDAARSEVLRSRVPRGQGMPQTAPAATVSGAPPSHDTSTGAVEGRGLAWPVRGAATAESARLDTSTPRRVAAPVFMRESLELPGQADEVALARIVVGDHLDVRALGPAIGFA